MARDFSQGPLSQTGAPLDVAIDGKGFFQIQTADGTRYTRDGRFSLDASGKLVTQDGYPVQGDGGDIALDPQEGRSHHRARRHHQPGTASSQLGKLSVVNFARPAAL